MFGGRKYCLCPSSWAVEMEGDFCCDKLKMLKDRGVKSSAGFAEKEGNDAALLSSDTSGRLVPKLSKKGNRK